MSKEKKKTEGLKSGKISNLFKSKEPEKPETEKEEVKEPTLDEQLQDLEKRLESNSKEIELTQDQVSKVRKNLEDDFKFLDEEITRMRKGHTGSIRGESICGK